MEVMILAAGMGSRLGKITEEVPKCLVEVNGVPMLQRAIIRSRDAGAKKIVINLFYLKEKVREYLNSMEDPGVEIVLSEEPELYNTGGGFKFAEKYFSKNSPIIVFNADIYCNISLLSLYEEHLNSDRLATLVTRVPEEPRVLTFSEDRLLTGWKNKSTGDEKQVGSLNPTLDRGFCGIQCVSPVIFNHLLRPEEKESIINGYLRGVEAGLEVGEFPIDQDQWFDIGTPEELKRLQDFLVEEGLN